MSLTIECAQRTPPQVQEKTAQNPRIAAIRKSTLHERHLTPGGTPEYSLSSIDPEKTFVPGIFSQDDSRLSYTANGTPIYPDSAADSDSDFTDAPPFFEEQKSVTDEAALHPTSEGAPNESVTTRTNKQKSRIRCNLM